MSDAGFWWRAVWVVLGALLLSGCDSGTASRSTLVPRWTLVTSSSRVDVVAPVHFTELVARDAPSFHLEADVVLSAEDRGVPLVLGIPLLQANASLEVNGRPATKFASGIVDGYRSSAPQEFYVDDAATRGRDVIHLDLRVEHRWACSTWFDTVPRLYRFGDEDAAIAFARLANGAISLSCAAATAAFALLYFAIYLADRTRPTNLWFAVGALAAGYYAIYQTGVPQVIVGSYDLNLASISISVGSVAEIYYTHFLLGLRPPSRVWLLALALGILVPGLSLDERSTPRWLLCGILCTTIAAVYQILLLARLSLTPSPPAGARLQLVAWLPLLPAFVIDCASFAGLGEFVEGARVAPVAMLAFAIFQSALLSRQHTRAVRKAESLGTDLRSRLGDLETQGRELGMLNTKLRRQIGDRSRQLMTALSAVEGRAAVLSLDEASVVGGKYQVTRKVGLGRVGTTYEAVRLSDGRNVGLSAAHGGSGQNLARLGREAQVASRVSHENLVSILDVDIAAEGFLYFVVEDFRAPPLAEVLGGPWSVEEASSVLLQVARGLLALHEAGLVHHDLQPRSILIDREGEGAPRVKLVDFGVTHKLHTGALGMSPATKPSTDEEATRTLATAAAPTNSGSISSGHVYSEYVAPEFADTSFVATAASDVFSFGVLAAAILAASPPFPEPCAAVLRACVSPDPSGRPSIAELLAALATVPSPPST